MNSWQARILCLNVDQRFSDKQGLNLVSISKHNKLTTSDFQYVFLQGFDNDLYNEISANRARTDGFKMNKS